MFHADNLKAKLKSLVGKTVVFTKNVEDLEDYAESGMKARVQDFIIKDSELTIIKFDFDFYKNHNSQYETSNYYDKYGRPTLNAHEAGIYKPIQDMYLPSNLESIMSYMNVVTLERQDTLLQKYQNSQTDKTYLEWLEDVILAAEDQGFELDSVLQNNESNLKI
jgi:hypothetical protein